MAQTRKIPGADATRIDVNKCNNPTFSGGRNLLIQNAPYPQACDKQGSDQCATGTGGNKNTTPVSNGSSGGSGSNGGSGSGGGSGTGASGGSGSGGSGAGASGGSGSGGATSGSGSGTAGTGGRAGPAEEASSTPTPAR